MLLKEPCPTQRLVLTCYDDYAVVMHHDTEVMSNDVLLVCAVYKCVNILVNKKCITGSKAVL